MSNTIGSNIIGSLTGANINIQQLASDLTSATKAPQQAILDQRRATAEAKISSVGKIQAAASAYKDSLTALGDPRSLPYTPSSSDPTVASFSFRSFYQPSAIDFSFRVTQLATENKMSFSGLASAGTFNLNGTSITYTSLTNLRDQIRAVSGYGATILNNADLLITRGTGTAAQFFASATQVETQTIAAGDTFTLSSISNAGVISLPGASGSLAYSSLSDLETKLSALSDYSVTNNGTSLSVTYNGTSGGTVTLSRNTTTSSGLDATITANGITYTSATNRFSSLISGVNIDVKAVSATDVTIKTEKNNATFVSALQTIVDGYNELIKVIKNEVQYDKDITKRGGLSGDSTARTFMSQLRRITTEPITGYLSVSVTLAQAGITTNRDGTLSIDVDKVDSLISSDSDVLEAVVASKTGNKGAIDRMKDLVTTVMSSNSSLQLVASNASSKELRSIDIETERLNTQMEMLQARYIKQFTEMQNIVNSSSKTQSDLSSMMAAWSASLKG